MPFAIAGLVLAALPSCRDPRPAQFLPPIELPRSAWEGAARGFPELRTRDGETLAKGEFAQAVDGDRLHLQVRYDYGSGRFTEERSVIRQGPELVQESWSWREVRDGEVQRRFEIDFLGGNAVAEKLEKGKLRQWSKHLDIQAGRAFAGTGYSIALRSLRDRLRGGERIELQGIGFMPKPRTGVVEVSFTGVDQIAMSGRTLSGEHFVIHPKIPVLLRPFVHVPDSHIWLLTPEPRGFLRWEGPVVEPSDPIVRVDLLPGGDSGSAKAVSR